MNSEDQNALEERYNYLFQNEWCRFLDYGPSARTRYRILLRLVNDISSSGKHVSLLDSGCGTGQFLSLLHRNGYTHLSGCDFSEESILLASKNFELKNIKLHRLFKADLTDAADFQGQAYDIVTCSEVLEHIPDHDAAIDTLCKMLVKNGYLLVSVPYRMKYWSAHDDLSLHIRRYEPKEMETLLERHGLRIVNSYVWGALIYEGYSRILTKVPPAQVMSSGEPGLMKRLVCKTLYTAFRLDDVLTKTGRGRRIFVVAQKTT